MRKKSQFPDLFTPDGFVAGQMIVHALQKGDYDVDKMIGALEGWKFLAPKGWQAIRPQDHAMLQPMFRVSLSQVEQGLDGEAARHRLARTRRRRPSRPSFQS